jgi:hypothetical protein
MSQIRFACPAVVWQANTASIRITPAPRAAIGRSGWMPVGASEFVRWWSRVEVRCGCQLGQCWLLVTRGQVARERTLGCHGLVSTRGWSLTAEDRCVVRIQPPNDEPGWRSGRWTARLRLLRRLAQDKRRSLGACSHCFRVRVGDPSAAFEFLKCACVPLS